ncbi:hypothetical protein [Paraburkholderia humisilvae]|uniref:Uncharacterized protein n=1 Tax=Paraburkholderia humisilvae TaxID=627669 RepID=A0A6J5DMN2_9BURK|nr:hypothetical protein [Paraburkholderia humisilvae]CAB3755449.1 hypothetical protein LMG29542_02597 [Paraburkholderia humisilvae]
MSNRNSNVRRKQLAAITPSGQRLTMESYKMLRDRLLNECPEVQHELARAVSSLPKAPGDVNAVWNALGSKPLFSNTKLTLAARYTKAWDDGLFPSMEEFLSSEWEIRYVPVAKKGWRSNSCYMYNAKRVGELHSRLKREGAPSVSISRLHAIRSSALWLRQRVDEVGVTGNLFDLNLENCTSAEALYGAVAPFCCALGIGWGQTTVFHALVDVGFDVVKPDIHVTRTLAFFSELPKSETACKKTRNYLAQPYGPATVVHAARTLAKSIEPLTISNGNAYREVDIILLHASATDLLTTL